MDWLSILGMVISIIGVLLSLLLFNASVNNGRKVIINDVITKIDKGLFFIYNPYLSDDEKINYINDYVRKFIDIDKRLNEINFNSKVGIPLIHQRTMYKDNLAIQEFDLDASLKELFLYFEKRNIYGIDFLFDFHSDRLSILQMYSQKRKYKRLFKIGPIIGIKITATRKRKEVFINKEKSFIIPVKNIKSEKDFKRYYDEFYLEYSSLIPNQLVEFERSVNNIIKTTKQGEKRPITFYY